MRVRILLLTAVLSLLTAMAFAQSSVPNLINFQGKLTDPAGNPVTDGSHGVNFSLWTLPTGGVSVWSEITTQTTAGGLFTHQLGSVTPLPQALFLDQDSLFLEIVADGQTITSRTRLTSVPYSRLAGGLEVPSTFNPATWAVRTLPVGNIYTYGDDGQEQIRLWGNSWGEIFLHDSDPTNDLTVTLTANASSGGELRLGDNNGATQIDLHGGLTGDASAVFPNNAINAAEMQNEPGIASGFSSGTVTLTGTDVNLDSAVITVPSAGYVVVIASAYYDPSHTNGTKDIGRFTISKTAGVIDFTSMANISTPAVVATDNDVPLPVALHRVDTVNAAGTRRYYFVADAFIGTPKASRARITAMFFPTNYGTVDITVAAAPGRGEYIPDPSRSDGGFSEAGQGAEVRHFTVEDHNARLEAELAKMRAEMESRIKQLEERVNQTQQAGSNEN